MNPVRSKLALLLYLTTLVLWSFSTDENRELKREMERYSEAIAEYDALRSKHDSLVVKHKVVLKYANSWYDIDWDKAIELANIDAKKESVQSP